MDDKHNMQPRKYHQAFQDLMRELSDSLQKTHNISVSDSFIIIVIKLVTLNPQNKFSLKQVAMDAEMRRLRQIAIEFIAGMTQIQRNIIRMQLHYLGNHFPRSELLQAHQVEIENHIKDLMDDLRNGVPKHSKQRELYYKKLVAAIIAKIDMGSARDTHVVKDTQEALASVFPEEELNLLADMKPTEREKEIKHLVTMVSGVRLYNRELDPAAHGHGIDDVLSVLPDKIYRCARILSELRERNIQRLIKYTVLVQPYFNAVNPTSQVGRRDISQDMLLIRQGLVMIHQLLVYIKELSDELTTEDSVCDKYTKLYRETVKDLEATVRDNTSVSTFIVYPKFIAIAEAWKQFQDSITFMDTILELIKSLVEYSENDLEQLDPLVDRLSNALRIPDESTFFEFPKEEVPDGNANNFVLANRSEFLPNMDPLSMMYSGFCVWSLVKGLGLVLLANPNLGVFSWRNKQFLLSSVEAAEDFRKDPDSFIHKAILVARRWPELIFLLKMDDQVFNPDAVVFEDDRPQTPMVTRISQETAVQTDTHPVESRIDQGYTWNEWEYRRRAVALASISKYATHSTQTHGMSMKSSVKVQTYPMKTTKVQTKQDVASEIPMSQFYFWGLRGCHKHPPHIVELSRDEPLNLRCYQPPKKPPHKKHTCF